MSITTPNPIGKTARSLPAFYKEATRSLAAINFTYVRHYNERRPHQSLQHLPPEAPDAYPGEGSIVARPVLGGLINDYHRLAA